MVVSISSDAEADLADGYWFYVNERRDTDRKSIGP